MGKRHAITQGLCVMLFSVGVAAQGADHESFNPDGALHCATAVGGYNDIEKFTLRPLGKSDTENRRHLQTRDTIYVDACEQTPTYIRCSIKRSLVGKYLIEVDLQSAQELDPDTQLTSRWILNGFIKKSLGFKYHSVSCRQ